MLHHFILTRFNIRLFRYDKHGRSINKLSWLDERLNLFETYTLPSVIGQTCQDFTWILLVDSQTPESYRERMMGYRKQCQQITFVAVKEEHGWQFANIFQQVVNKLLKERGAKEGDVCLTTYFDNDDCLNRDYVKDIHDILQKNGNNILQGDGVLAFDYGIQYYTELGIATRVKYANNHFITLFERISSAENPSVRTCYGYGSHIDIEKRKAALVHHVTLADKPMWVEVIHKDNVDNDVKMTLDFSFIGDRHLLQRDFSLDITLQSGRKAAFFTRFLKQVRRRLHDKFIPRQW